MGMVPRPMAIILLVRALLSDACDSFFPLLPEDDFVLAIIGATGAEAAPLWNRAFDGGVASSGVAGTDVGSIHSSSSGSPPSVDTDAVRVKLTARVFPDVFSASGVLPVTIVVVEPGVKGPAGSSSAYRIRFICFWIPRAKRPGRHWQRLRLHQKSRRHQSPPIRPPPFPLPCLKFSWTVRCHIVSVSLAAPDGSDPALLAPVDCHLACAPPIDELLIDKCF